MAGAAAHRDPHSPPEGLSPAARPLGGGRAAGHAAAEDATTEKRALERSISMHPAAAESRYLACGEEPLYPRAVGVQDASGQIRSESSERLACQDPQAHCDERRRV